MRRDARERIRRIKIMWDVQAKFLSEQLLLLGTGKNKGWEQVKEDKYWTRWQIRQTRLALQKIEKELKKLTKQAER